MATQGDRFAIGHGHLCSIPSLVPNGKIQFSCVGLLSFEGNAVGNPYDCHCNIDQSWLGLNLREDRQHITVTAAHPLDMQAAQHL